MECLRTDTPPALTERDKVIRKDAEWQAAAEQYAQLKAEASEIAKRLDSAKEALESLITHPSESGFGVTVTRYFKQGAIDYKRVPVLAGVDLEDYRQKGRWETRITLA